MAGKQNESSSTMFSRESRSFRNKDSVKVISLKGARSLSLNRERRKVRPNKGFIFNSNGESNNGDKNIFTIRRFSRRGNTGSLQHLNNTGSHIHRTSSDSDVNNDWKFKNFRSGDVQNTESGNMQEAKVDFKTLVTMFLKRSSIYALNQVGNSSTKRRKIFWAFILIFGLLGSGIQIVEYLRAYFSYPVVVNMDSVSLMNQEFPAVTICNLNRIRKEFVPCLKKHINHTDCNPSEVQDIDLFLALDNDNATHCSSDYYDNKLDYELLRQIVWQSLFTKLTPESQDYYGHQKDKFIRTCSFNGEKCSTSDFSKEFDFVYGNCFTFNAARNGKQPLNTSFVGPNGGLEVELDLEVDEYADYTRSVGARVEVHDPYHTAIINENGINVSPGFETSIALSKSETIRLPKPYKDNCMMYETGEGLHKCLRICQNNLLQNHCSCVIDKSVNIRQCDLTKLSDFCCVYKPQQYTCDCPLPCEDTDYLSSIFSAVWPSGAYYDAIYSKETNYTLEKYRTNRVKLKVYYDTLETVIYKQKPMYQSSELFSQIGGQMGLWLGLSLVAIFECIENFVLLWQYRSKHSNK